MKNKKSILDKYYKLILFVILIVQIATIIFFAAHKEGYHQDEYYSYFSTNRTLGFYYPDREWVSTDTIRDEFVVKKGEGFNYGMVKLVQSWDVHPPFFYDLLHTVCSLTPGVFSKWQGIFVNLIAFVLSFMLVNLLARDVGMARDLRLVLMLAYGFNPMTISCVMFIRMYMWLTVFVLASAFCHMRLISLIKEHYMRLDCGMGALDDARSHSFAKRFSKNLVLLMAIDFLGFFTQYYYLIFMASIGLFFCLWFLFLMPVKEAAKVMMENEKYRVGILDRLKFVLLYGVCSGAALALAIALYPSSLSHIFRGYRGQEAAQAFTDVTNLPERIGFFLGLVGKYLFAGLWQILFVLVVLALIGLFFFIRTKREKDKLHIAHVRILLASGTLYFLLVAKTALLLGDTSNRYEMPVYPIAILLVVYFTKIGVRTAIGNREFKGVYLPVLVTFIVFAVITVKGLAFDQNVLFLYPEDAQRIAYAAKKNDEGTPVLVMFNDATPDNIWRLTDELLEYDELYYVSEAETAPITDERIIAADEILVYAADHDNRDEILEGLKQEGAGLTEVEIVSVKDMWTLYRLRKS